jgi:uncharacterized membrane protein YdjX (TVP38/TMEM64 family)
MTPGQALGMLLVGVIALSIGAGIAFLILRKVYRNLRENKNKYVFRPWDDLE